jgi:DNA replication protein DnaC
MAKLTADQRRDLMEVTDDRHQRGSTLVATQIPLERWHDQIGDPTYGDAILDRLVHNAFIASSCGGGRCGTRGYPQRESQAQTTA